MTVIMNDLQLFTSGRLKYLLCDSICVNLKTGKTTLYYEKSENDYPWVECFG